MYLVTRPEPKQAASANAFAQAGLNASVVALQRIQHDPHTAVNVTEWVNQHSDGILIVTSTAAVDALRNTGEHTNIQLPASLHVVAVGKSTAKALGVFTNAVITPEQENSDGVLSLPRLRDCADQRILLLKGKGGRTRIQDELLSRGARLTIFDVYERKPLAAPVLSQPIDWEAISGIVATSGEQAQCLINEYKAQPLSQFRWLTVSERIAEQLRQQGIQQVGICPQANDPSLIAWIKDNWE